MAEESDDYDNNTDSEDELDIIGNNFIGGNKSISESDWADTDDEESENMDDELNIDENVYRSH